MKNIFCIFAALTVCYGVYAQKDCIRADYSLTLKDGRAEVEFSGFVSDGLWSGISKETSVGVFRFVLTDKKTGKTLYSYSFNSLFGEWVETDLSKKEEKVFLEAVRFPRPKRVSVAELFMKNSGGEYEKIFQKDVFPDSLEVKLERRTKGYKNKINIAVVPEGYDEDSMADFLSDAGRLTDAVFEYEPFKTYKKKFCIRTVLRPCASGFSYYTFGTERYLMTDNFQAVCKAASCGGFPWDFVIVLVNSEKYGGGGIYNFYASVAAKNYAAREVLVHECGHSFANLDDEYDEADQNKVTDCIMCRLDRDFCPVCKENIKNVLKKLFK